ncbi:MAG: hypothetical protein OWQ54_05110 [Sulfolobaceae archaeon]|nr:hypothetical protein [Sulfolobaceae archaeon]
MDWAKVSAIIAFIVIIILVGYYNQVYLYFLPSYTQIHNILSTNKFRIDRVIINSTGIYIEASNKMSETITIYNITGPDLWLQKVQVIPPNSIDNFRLSYSNLTQLEENIAKGVENVSITIGIGELNVTEVVSI